MPTSPKTDPPPGTLLAGAAAVDITPAVGIHMGGYWGRRSGAVGIADPLFAKAVVWQKDRCRAGLVSLDLIGLAAASVAAIRRQVEARTGLAARDLMVCCSHTHAGPLTLPFRGMGQLDDGYLQNVEAAAVAAVEAAAGALQPVAQYYARVPVQLGHNRRQDGPGGTKIGVRAAGPVVPYAHALWLEADGAPLATLFSHACHPVVLGNANHRISAEFPGAAARAIEAASGGMALFFNGACGDINPRLTGAEEAAVERLGIELARAVLEGRPGAAELAGPVGGRCETLGLPLIEPPSRWRLEAEKLVLRLKAELKGVVDGGGDEWARLVPEARLQWACQMRQVAARGGEPQPFELQALAVGGAVLLGMEGEIFARYQLDIEGGEAVPTMVCGYANGCIGYVPTADEYARGGYEVEEAYKVYPSVQMVAPQSERLILERARALLRAGAANGP